MKNFNLVVTICDFLIFLSVTFEQEEEDNDEEEIRVMTNVEASWRFFLSFLAYLTCLLRPQLVVHSLNNVVFSLFIKA